jgi:hypothetical protein
LWKWNLALSGRKEVVGAWKEGKKHGKGYYEWPNGSRYHLVYTEGRKKDNGQLENTKVSLAELKQTYRKIAKKASAGKQFVADTRENWHVEDFSKNRRCCYS